MKILDHELDIPQVFIDEFTTPYWHDVLHDIYPRYLATAKHPLEVRPFLIQFCNELANRGVRGRTSLEWMDRLIEHFGLLGFQELLDAGYAAYAEAKKLALAPKVVASGTQE